MKKILLTIITLFTATSFANKQFLQVGIHNDHAKVDNTTSNDQLNYQLGLIGSFPLNDLLAIRLGGIVSTKNIQVENSTFNTKVNAKKTFLTAPLAIQFALSSFQLYAGVDFAVKLTSTCEVTALGVTTDCNFNEEKNLVIQPELGGEYIINDMFNVGVFYQYDSLYDKDTTQSAYGATFGYNF